MGRGGKEKEKLGETEANPEAEERKRLRKLAVSKNLLSEAPAKGSSVAVSPSKTVVKHHGKDIIRKSNRKNRFLFSFPGLIAPISGGKIGELKNLDSKNPILYLDFPQGQMKLFGTIVYPKNRYLTLQFSRGGKNVMCEDYFDTMIVFSEAWWIGRKEENPEEVRLDFPDDLNMVQQNVYDFKGGAGSTSERMQGVKSREITAVAHHSPVHEVEDDSSDSQNDLKDLIQATPTRHSARNAGKSFKFQESGEDDAFDIDTETSDRVENEIGEGGSISKVAMLGTKVSEKLPESGVSATKMKDGSCSNRSSLVQTTISTLFKRKEEKFRRQTTKKQPEDSSDEDWEASEA